jgi:hypothetical protein
VVGALKHIAKAQFTRKHIVEKENINVFSASFSALIFYEATVR